MGGAPIRFAGGTANIDLVWRAAGDGQWMMERTRADVIEVVSKAVNEGSSWLFLASLDSFFDAGVVTLVRSLLI